MRGAADESVYVGDILEKDFIAPKALGWKTVRVYRDLSEHRNKKVNAEKEADVTITTLDDLKETLG